MEGVVEMIDGISCGDRTLLLVDQTEGEQTHNIFLTSAKYVVLDAEKISMKMTVKKQSIASILEECRFQLTFAMKYGKTLVVRFGYHMTDFKFTFCDERCPGLDSHQKHNHLQKARYLPRGFMMDSGAGLREEAMVRALYHREDIIELIQDAEEDQDEVADIAHFVPVCHPDFKVVMTTSMPYEKLDDFHFHVKYGLPSPRDTFDIRRFSLHQTLTEGESA
jgi:hypothetical protein